MGPQVLTDCHQVDPDGAKVDKKKATVKQTDKENLVSVDFSADGTQMFDGSLVDCKTAKLDGSVDDRKGTGKIKLDAKNCGTDVSGDQVSYIADTCADTKAVKGNYNGTQVKSLKINVKGSVMTVTPTTTTAAPTTTTAAPTTTTAAPTTTTAAPTTTTAAPSGPST